MLIINMQTYDMYEHAFDHKHAKHAFLRSLFRENPKLLEPTLRFVSID